jgi:hypothetical protein
MSWSYYNMQVSMNVSKEHTAYLSRRQYVRPKLLYPPDHNTLRHVSEDRYMNLYLH